MPNTLVVRITDLPKLSAGFIKPQGLGVSKTDVFLDAILRHAFWADKKESENDPAVKQVIIYSAVVNMSPEKIFVYRRASKDKDYAEKRLQGNLSIGVGGHSEQDEDGIASPLLQNFRREMRQEVGLDVSEQDFIPLGYLNSEDNVGQAYFGILNIVYCTALSREPRHLDPEIKWSKMMSFSEAEKLLTDPNEKVEEWTRLAFPIVKDWVV